MRQHERQKSYSRTPTAVKVKVLLEVLLRSAPRIDAFGGREVLLEALRETLIKSHRKLEPEGTLRLRLGQAPGCTGWPGTSATFLRRVFRSL
jgi:hypothetical protein